MQRCFFFENLYFLSDLVKLKPKLLEFTISLNLIFFTYCLNSFGSKDEK